MKFADLHCHILPGIDDGAKNPDVSLELLRREADDGVVEIALTPHFRFQNCSIAEFITRRKKALQWLEEPFEKSGLQIQLHPGAEVLFSSDLLNLEWEDLILLCIENTSVMLIEFPFSHYPGNVEDTLFRLNLMGITPLIAHVERYPYFAENPNRLIPLIEAGAYVQVNASSMVMHRDIRQRVYTLLRHNLAHVLSTDTHSLDKRPPLLGKAFSLVRSKLGEETASALAQNSLALVQGRLPEVFAPTSVRTFFGKFY